MAFTVLSLGFGALLVAWAFGAGRPGNIVLGATIWLAIAAGALLLRRRRRRISRDTHSS